MRLIDADTLMEKEYSRLREGEVLHRIPPSHVDAAPTIDAVPVVRCRECKHARKSEEAFDFDGETPLCECAYMTQPNRWHEFCSWGKRKEG